MSSGLQARPLHSFGPSGTTALVILLVCSSASFEPAIPRGGTTLEEDGWCVDLSPLARGTARFLRQGVPPPVDPPRHSTPSNSGGEGSLRHIASSASPPPQTTDSPPSQRAETTPGWNQFISEVSRRALLFTEDLPNFVCTQTTRRYLGDTGTAGWRLDDILEAELSFNERKESYSKVRVNGRESRKRFESLGGTLSVGEFGSILRALFLTEVQSAFRKEREDTLKGKIVVVAAFSVPQANSQWTLSFKNTHSLRVGYHGWIWIDSATHQVLRITQRTEQLPAGFPIVYSETTTEYGSESIRGLEGQEFLLPLNAELIIQEAQPRRLTRNLITFRDFRRFTAEVKFREN
jgi:hypothetical protein